MSGPLYFRLEFSTTECVFHTQKNHWASISARQTLEPKIIAKFVFLCDILVTSVPVYVFRKRRRASLKLRAPLGARTRTNNKLNPHMTPGPGDEPRPYWWEASERSHHCAIPAPLTNLIKQMENTQRATIEIWCKREAAKHEWKRNCYLTQSASINLFTIGFVT